MPGNEVKKWSAYEALRRRGLRKTVAARIANAQAKRDQRKRAGRKGGKATARKRRRQRRR